MTPTRTAPLYAQVARRIVEDLGPDAHSGQKLPSERGLSERLGVSRVTLRSALTLLAEDGVVAPLPARGWFIRAVPPRDNPPVSGPYGPSGPTGPTGSIGPASVGRVNGFSDVAGALGQQTSALVLSAEVRGATLDEADTFAVVPGSPMFDLRRLRRIENLVIAVDHSRVPLAVCPTLPNQDFSTSSLYETLRRASEPVQPTSADYSVEASPASPAEATLLELPPGFPLLVARQQTRDQRGQIFELGETRYRGDRYRFRATLGLVT